MRLGKQFSINKMRPEAKARFSTDIFTLLFCSLLLSSLELSDAKVYES